MKVPSFILACLASTAIHVAVFTWAATQHHAEAEILFKQGDSAVELTILPSLASVAKEAIRKNGKKINVVKEEQKPVRVENIPPLVEEKTIEKNVAKSAETPTKLSDKTLVKALNKTLVRKSRKKIARSEQSRKTFSDAANQAVEMIQAVELLSDELLLPVAAKMSETKDKNISKKTPLEKAIDEKMNEQFLAEDLVEKNEIAKNMVCDKAKATAPQMSTNKESTIQKTKKKIAKKCVEKPIGKKVESIAGRPVSVNKTEKMNELTSPQEQVASVNSAESNGDLQEKGVTTLASANGLQKPKYPRYSRIHGHEGVVVLNVEVAANGRVSQVDLLQSSGYRRLDRAAMRAVQKAIFTAAKRNGRSIASVKKFAFRFDLNES